MEQNDVNQLLDTLAIDHSMPRPYVDCREQQQVQITIHHYLGVNRFRPFFLDRELNPGVWPHILQQAGRAADLQDDVPSRLFSILRERPELLCR
jgi:hypothetical protein